MRLQRRPPERRPRGATPKQTAVWRRGGKGAARRLLARPRRPKAQNRRRKPYPVGRQKAERNVLRAILVRRARLSCPPERPCARVSAVRRKPARLCGRLETAARPVARRRPQRAALMAPVAGRQRGEIKPVAPPKLRRPPLPPHVERDRRALTRRNVVLTRRRCARRPHSPVGLAREFARPRLAREIVAWVQRRTLGSVRGSARRPVSAVLRLRRSAPPPHTPQRRLAVRLSDKGRPCAERPSQNKPEKRGALPCRY